MNHYHKSANTCMNYFENADAKCVTPVCRTGAVNSEQKVKQNAPESALNHIFLKIVSYLKSVFVFMLEVTYTKDNKSLTLKT